VPVERLRDDRLLAEPRAQRCGRRLPGPEAGHARVLREVADRVLEGVVDVVGRDLDLQPDAVAVEAFKRRLHHR